MPDEHQPPRDLFVERPEYPTMQRAVARMLTAGKMRDEWLCPPEETDEWPR